MTDKQQALNLAKELQEYTRVVGSHNQKINQTADELVERLGSPSLTDDQQEVLEWLKWKRQEGSQPIECLYTLAFGDAIEPVIIAYINLTDTEQYQVLAEFPEWGLGQLNDE